MNEYCLTEDIVFPLAEESAFGQEQSRVGNTIVHRKTELLSA